MNEQPWKDGVLFLSLHGSFLYGTSTPESDVDLRGVCHQTIASLIGLSPFEQYDAGKSEDTTIYGLSKFCQLACDCNPNIVELLFAPTSGETCKVMTPMWRELLNIRGAFLSRKARHSFVGYSYGQLKRIELHHRWLVNPPKKAPVPEEYGATQKIDGPYSWPNQEAHNAYQNLHAQWKQYQEWLVNRNPVRAELERKFGMDTKHALHLVRLISEGKELLQTGIITLPRPDAKYLLEVRNGLLTYEQVVQLAADADKEMEELEKTSPLAWGADRKTVEDFVMRVNARRVAKFYRTFDVTKTYED